MGGFSKIIAKKNKDLVVTVILAVILIDRLEACPTNLHQRTD